MAWPVIAFMAITHTHCGPMVGQQIVLRLLLKWKCTNIIVLFAYCYYSHFSCYSTHTRSLGGLVNNNNNARSAKTTAATMLLSSLVVVVGLSKVINSVSEQRDVAE